MKIWLVKRIGRTDWGEYIEFVIRAANEKKAREIAAYKATEECDFSGAWLDPDLSTCEELTNEGEEGCIVGDFRHG